jgi:hypothetical protein
MPALQFDEHATRYALHVRVHYRRGTERTYRPEAGWTRDLNLRGAWVELPETVPAGTLLALALVTPTGALPLPAHVAWAAPGLPDAPSLHGVCFTGLTVDCRRRLHALLDRAPPRIVTRLACVLVARCHRTDIQGPAIAGTVRDLANTGVGVRLPERVPPGTTVRIGIPAPYGRIAAVTQVVWADPPGQWPRDATYRHGLRFLGLDRSSGLPLQALLNGLE